MGEKITYVVFGALGQDLPECPHEDGWSEWAYRHPAFQHPKDSYGVFLENSQFRSSYEADPGNIGFVVISMEYGEVWVLGGPGQSEAEVSWDKLRELASLEGVKLPPGRLIISHDE